MASLYSEKADLHFDATTGTISDEFGEIGGVMSVSYTPPQRNRGRVVTVGHRLPSGWTPGALAPGEARITMYRRDAMTWLLINKSAYGPRSWGDIPKTFIVTYAPIDEESSQLPAQVDSFMGLLNPPGDLSFDRGQEGGPLMVEIPIFLVGPMTLHGTQII